MGRALNIFPQQKYFAKQPYQMHAVSQPVLNMTVLNEEQRDLMETKSFLLPEGWNMLHIIQRLTGLIRCAAKMRGNLVSIWPRDVCCFSLLVSRLFLVIFFLFFPFGILSITRPRETQERLTPGKSALMRDWLKDIGSMSPLPF